jgi:hypothetical protein
MKATYFCEQCKQEKEITDNFPKYIKGKELCKSCFLSKVEIQ